MMQDPMTDFGATPKSTLNDNATKQVVDGLALQLNLKRLDRIRSVMGITSGCIAGILGCTGLQGLRKFVCRMRNDLILLIQIYLTVCCCCCCLRE